MDTVKRTDEVKIDGVKIVMDYNESDNLIGGYMKKESTNVSISKRRSGWVMSIDTNGVHRRLYTEMTWEQVIARWDKKLKELKQQ